MKFIPCKYCKGGYREGDEEEKQEHEILCKQRREWIIKRNEELEEIDKK